jgi:hypothetical protein
LVKYKIAEGLNKLMMTIFPNLLLLGSVLAFLSLGKKLKETNVFTVSFINNYKLILFIYIVIKFIWYALRSNLFITVVLEILHGNKNFL